MDFKERNTFTKEDSLKIKGIAAVMILIFHFFRSAKAMKKLSLVTIPFSVNSMAYLSYLCKMGICVFAFITGYGLLLSIKNRQMSKEQTLKW